MAGSKSRRGAAEIGLAPDEETLGMGIVIAFPADAASRPGSTMDRAADRAMGIVVILPVIRIDRDSEETSGGHGPEEGTAPGRRRRRRARS
jgi:hypothetical protein